MTEQSHAGGPSEAALAKSLPSLPATEAGFPVLNSGQGKPASLINGVSTLNQTGTAPATDSAEETSERKSQTVNTTAAAPPKMSWANLFKGTSSSSPSVVVYKDDTEKSVPVVSQSVPTPPVTMSASSEVVSVDNDSVATKLGEYLSTVSLVHASVALQPRGLVNKANWCYVNATLQALVACPPFYHLFKNLAELPLSRSASSTPILDSLVQFTSEFHKQERQDRSNVRRGKHVELVPGPIFEPEYVYKMLQHTKVPSSFKHGLQEDAEEFLSCVLDGLHEEMLAAIRHATGGENGASPTNGYPIASNPSDNNADTTDDVGSMDEDEWQEVGPKNRGAHTRKTSMIAKTPIAKMFSGLIRSAIMQASSKERATLQPFFTLQLDIQGEKVNSVREALEHFVSKESIQGFTCSKTGEEVEVVKRITLEELPPVLILHLKCFVYDQTGGCQKLIKNIKFDVDLNITKDLLSATGRSKLQQAQRVYKLFAVVFHHGKKATGGHYTTDVFHPGINGWVHMDDSRILPVQEIDVLNYHPPKMPYLLYYRRRDLATSS
ncbi:ubiquitin carboxyl-terminal hydrolase 10-like [Pomacea canaliculata]|uniref:ubiquitin carboxyl-terminal hydrolase 10-like n=1 Tax=Pomacea canaliculata TaxID=400727 RepID=UPI000D734B88|nr:ubiquitin carboxyl-terminal hydrolase 10-like [Pomacea canaliculata]